MGRDRHGRRRVGLFFSRAHLAVGGGAGLAAGLVSLAANAGGSLLGRKVNREARLPSLQVTFVSIAIGSAVLLSAGVAIEGMPSLDLRSGAVVAWLPRSSTPRSPSPSGTARSGP